MESSSFNFCLILRSDELVEPQASALAKLSAYCVFAFANLDNVEPFTHPNPRKRNRPEDYEVCRKKMV